jgi:type I restriction enzyme R subunit
VAAFQAQQEQVSQELQSTKTQLSSISEERSVWEQLATESDADKARLAEQLAALQAAATAAPAAQFTQLLQSAANAATQVQLDEAETRRIIDEQLRQAGWEADTPNLRYSKGTRPQRGRNMAIAEWPCEGYSADYVLFQGLSPISNGQATELQGSASDLEKPPPNTDRGQPGAPAQHPILGKRALHRQDTWRPHRFVGPGRKQLPVGAGIQALGG